MGVDHFECPGCKRIFGDVSCGQCGRCETLCCMSCDLINRKLYGQIIDVDCAHKDEEYYHPSFYCVDNIGKSKKCHVCKFCPSNQHWYKWLSKTI
jgi:hypothetical protein